MLTPVLIQLNGEKAHVPKSELFLLPCSQVNVACLTENNEEEFKPEVSELSLFAQPPLLSAVVYNYRGVWRFYGNN